MTSIDRLIDCEKKTRPGTSRRHANASISAQRGIAVDLSGREDGAGADVSRKMNAPKAPRLSCDCRRQSRHRPLIRGTAGKGLVELALPSDDRLSQEDGLGMHRRVNALDLLSLSFREGQCFRHVEHMARAGIAIELRCDS